MDLKEFKQNRIEGRKQLFEKIVVEFKNLNPLAIHQFGSGSKGFKDEFSDLDVWITFKDEDIERALRLLGNTFRTIAPVLVNHHSKSWSPVGGSSSSIIHETDFGLFIVDYYISKESETVIKEGSVVLYGSDSLKRGEWRLNRHIYKDVHYPHTIKKDVDLLVDLIFISFKGIVRKWENDDFIKTLRTIHKKFREKYTGKLKPRRINLNFKSNYRLLNDLYLISNKRQRKAINKIKKYGHQVEALYS